MTFFYEGSTIIEFDDDDDYHHTVTLFLDGTIFDLVDDNEPHKRWIMPYYPSNQRKYVAGDCESRSWAYSPVDDEYHDYVVHIWDDGTFDYYDYYDPEPPDACEMAEWY